MPTVPYDVFLSYSEANRKSVEMLAKRLKGDARVTFWFQPWHARLGKPLQNQMIDALNSSKSCAVFLGALDPEDFHSKQLQLAIQRQTTVNKDFRVIPVALPGAPDQTDGFLGLYEGVRFSSLEDEDAYEKLLAGIFDIAPADLKDYIQGLIAKEALAHHPKVFSQGHALCIGVSNYTQVNSLGSHPLNDARDLAGLLMEPGRCGYPPTQVKLLLDEKATRKEILAELKQLAERTGPADTAIIFFSGHGFQNSDSDEQYLLPHDSDLDNLASTALAMEELTEQLSYIRAGRLLVLLDCCHAGGAVEAKSGTAYPPGFKPGFTEEQLGLLLKGQGRVVIASCRAGEKSYAEKSGRNSVFTHFLLQALRGEAQTLGDGAVRVFSLFRHVSNQVPFYLTIYGVQQNPVFKAAALDHDFVVALCPPGNVIP